MSRKIKGYLYLQWSTCSTEFVYFIRLVSPHYKKMYCTRVAKIQLRTSVAVKSGPTHTNVKV